MRSPQTVLSNHRDEVSLDPPVVELLEFLSLGVAQLADTTRVVPHLIAGDSDGGGFVSGDALVPHAGDGGI